MATMTLVSVTTLAQMTDNGSQMVKTELKLYGETVESLIPPGWKHTEATGDLNKDGTDDLAIIAFPSEKDSSPMLAIYFGTINGAYGQWKSYSGIIPEGDGENEFIEPSLEITSRNTLIINLNQWASAGSWGTTNRTWTFRYQNDDFFLIGFDDETLMRNTGEVTKVSKNYLTHKCCTSTFNEFDKTVKPHNVWTKLPKTSLQRLGDFSLDM